MQTQFDCNFFPIFRNAHHVAAAVLPTRYEYSSSVYGILSQSQLTAVCFSILNLPTYVICISQLAQYMRFFLFQNLVSHYDFYQVSSFDILLSISCLELWLHRSCYIMLKQNCQSIDCTSSLDLIIFSRVMFFIQIVNKIFMHA